MLQAQFIAVPRRRETTYRTLRSSVEYVIGQRVNIEGTGGHEVWKFGDTSGEFRRWLDSRFTELFLGTEGRVRGVGIGFEFVDATEGFPKSGSEIVVLGEGRFADTGGRFGMIIEWGRRRRIMGCGSGDPLRWHCCLLLLIDRM